MSQPIVCARWGRGGPGEALIVASLSAWASASAWAAAPRRPALPRSRRAGRRTGRGRSPSADHARSSGGRCDVRHVRARARRARGVLVDDRLGHAGLGDLLGGVPSRSSASSSRAGPPHRRVRACAASPARGGGRGRARRRCRRAGA